MNEFAMRTGVQSPRAGLRAVAAMLACLSPGLVGAAATDAVDARFDEFRAHLGVCTKDFGYDPARSASYGKHELAPGEQKWRECAYEGIRKIMVPPSATPDSYAGLIGLDKVMTKEILAGNRTRAERQERIRKMIDDILAKEKAAEPAAAGASQTTLSEEEEAKLRAQRDQFVASQRELQKMRRFQSMMR